MDTVSEAPALLAALLPNGGAAFLRHGDLGATWEEALATVPPEVLAVPPGPQVALHQLSRLRDFWNQTQDLRPALAATKALHELAMARGGPDHPDALMELAALGTLAQRAGQAEQGGAMLEKAWGKLRAVLAGDDLRLAIVASNAAGHFVRTGRLAEAEAPLDLAYKIRSKKAPKTLAVVAAQLGEVRMKLGKLEKARTPLRQAWILTRDALGPNHPRSVARAHAFGLLSNQLERYPEAAEALNIAYLASLSGDPAKRAAVGFELGVAEMRSGKKEAGLRRVEEAVRLTRQLPNGPHKELPNRLTMLSQMKAQRGQHGEAEGLQLEALDVERRIHGDASPEVASRYATLGYFYTQGGRVAEGLGWLDAAASLLRSSHGDDDNRTRTIVGFQVGLLLDQTEAALKRRDRNLAGEFLSRALALAEPVLGHGDARMRRIRDIRLQNKI